MWRSRPRLCRLRVPNCLYRRSPESGNPSLYYPRSLRALEKCVAGILPASRAASYRSGYSPLCKGSPRRGTIHAQSSGECRPGDATCANAAVHGSALDCFASYISAGSLHSVRARRSISDIQRNTLTRANRHIPFFTHIGCAILSLGGHDKRVGPFLQKRHDEIAGPEMVAIDGLL